MEQQQFQELGEKLINRQVTINRPRSYSDHLIADYPYIVQNVNVGNSQIYVHTGVNYVWVHIKDITLILNSKTELQAELEKLYKAIEKVEERIAFLDEHHREDFYEGEYLAYKVTKQIKDGDTEGAMDIMASFLNKAKFSLTID